MPTLEKPSASASAPPRLRVVAPPSIPFTRRESERRVADCVGATALLARLHRDGRRGAALLRSGGTTRVAADALLRITLRGGRMRFEPLAARAVPLLENLERRVHLERRVTGAPRGDSFEVEVAPPLGRLAAGEGVPDDELLRAPSCLDPVRALLASLEERGAAAPLLAGVFAYEMVDRFEAIGPRREDPCDDDDLDLVLVGAAVRYDPDGRVRVVTRGLPWERRADVDARHDELLEGLAGDVRDTRFSSTTSPPRSPSPPSVLAPGRSDFESRPYLAAVGAVHEAIAAGDVFQTVLARSFEMECRAGAAELAAAFAELEPDADPYCLDLRAGALVGASPELFVDVAGGADDAVVVRPIAGTCGRPLRADGSRCRDADARAAAALQSSVKERAEHAMLVDLARNDVARVSRAGTTVVERPFVVEAQRHVLHLVSSVRGRRRPGLDALHVWRAVANMGTLTGAPKVRAMELLRAIEPIGRGSYGGAVGMLDGDGAFRSCIAIRGVRLRGGRALARAGAGIVRAQRDMSSMVDRCTITGCSAGRPLAAKMRRTASGLPASAPRP